MWELLIIAAGAPETTITFARYESEHVCRIEQDRLSKTFGEAMEHVVPKPDQNGFTWGPSLNCKKVEPE